MNRILLPVLASTLFLLANNQTELKKIENDIVTVKDSLKNKQKQEIKIKDSIGELAKTIISQKLKLNELTKKQQDLLVEIEVLSKDLELKSQRKDSLEEQKKELFKSKQSIERMLVDLVAKNLAQSLVLNQTQSINEKDIIKNQIFETIKNSTASEISKLRDTFITAEKSLLTVEKELTFIDNQLASLEQKRVEIVQVKNNEKDLLSNLEEKNSNYQNKLADILKKNEQERSFLAKLNIMKNETLDEIKKEKEEQEKLAQIQRNRSIDKIPIVDTSDIQIKQYGSSYFATRSGKYRGSKVAPPIDDSNSFKITKNFGPYMDPIYNIKIHNDSITIEPKTTNVIVRNVLDGRVVYADELQTMGKVVIIEHDNKMHTIYRNLDTISPNIKVQRKLKQRSAVGRVGDELVFEVTKDGIPINPLELIVIPKNI